MANLSYDEWHDIYDALLDDALDMNSQDLPDIYSEAEAYERGLTPKQAASECIALNLSEFGF